MVMLTLRTVRCVWRSAQCIGVSNFSSLPIASPKKLIFEEFGNPEDVLKLVDDDVAHLTSELKGEEVLLRILASPVNPSDINYIQGVYAIKPKSWPAVSGNEGVMEVLQTGPAVSHLRPGDRVIPASAGIGLWRHLIRLPASSLLPTAPGLPVPAAATLVVNPCTAHRLLADFADLRAGEWLLQNAATSAVGLQVAQMARRRGVRVCGVIRARASAEETEKTRELLREWGAELVLTEAELRDKDAVRPLREAGGAKLTLNCVGGKQALGLFRLMSPGSCLVTYGAMAMSPIPLPASSLIFNDISLRGFWMTAWSARPENNTARLAMLEEVSRDLIAGHLRVPPMEEVKFEEFERAMSANQFGGKGPRSDLPLKQLLVM